MTVLERLRYRTKEADDALLEDMIESAKSVILSRRFPYGDYPVRDVIQEDGTVVQETFVESRYLDLQYRIALSVYDKDGADYEQSHSENGVSRSWGSEGVPKELIAEITPMCSPVR